MAEILLGNIGNGNAKIKVGDYIGTGKYGESNPNVLTFDFKVRFVMIFKRIADASNPLGIGRHLSQPVMFIRPSALSTFIHKSDENANQNKYNGGIDHKVIWGDKSVSWYVKEYITDNDTPYTNWADDQLNENTSNYYYIAAGYDDKT